MQLQRPQQPPSGLQRRPVAGGPPLGLGAESAASQAGGRTPGAAPTHRQALPVIPCGSSRPAAWSAQACGLVPGAGARSPSACETSGPAGGCWSQNRRLPSCWCPSRAAASTPHSLSSAPPGGHSALSRARQLLGPLVASCVAGAPGACGSPSAHWLLCFYSRPRLPPACPRLAGCPELWSPSLGASLGRGSWQDRNGPGALPRPHSTDQKIDAYRVRVIHPETQRVELEL